MNSTEQPRTLLQLAGVPSDPPALADSVVVVIDAQREYLDGGLALPAIKPALDSIATLLEAARSAGAPVIHVAHVGQPGGLFDPDEGGVIIDQVRPQGDESVVTKSLPNAFAGTTLRDELSQLSDPSLVLCGFMTHMCVSSTARAALDLGLKTTVVHDATATRDLPAADGTGGALSHDQVHQAALAGLADRFSLVTDVATLLG
ncbi:cysteine hydrolase family protein [soil metagenome]